MEQLKGSRTVLKIRVDNNEDKEQYIWSAEKFVNRLFIIRDIVNDYFDSGKLPKLSQEEDPFWDPTEAQLVGRAYYYLKNQANLFDNEYDCKIFNPVNMRNEGTIKINILPTDEIGEASESPLEIEDPEDMIGKRVDFNLQVKCAQNLPHNLCGDPYITWKFDEHSGEIKAKSSGCDQNPKFDFCKQLTMDDVSRDQLDYMLNDAAVFNLYAYPTDGKTNKKNKNSKAIKEEANIPEEKAPDAKQEKKKDEKPKKNDLDKVNKVQQVDIKKGGCCALF